MACSICSSDLTQRKLADVSRDLTTFQTPLGTLRLTSIPMGYTNSMQIQHGDITYLLRDEIPDFTIPFVDDIPVKGPPTRYELPNGGYEVIPENPGMRRFVWEHLQERQPCHSAHQTRRRHIFGTKIDTVRTFSSDSWAPLHI